MNFLQKTLVLAVVLAACVACSNVPRIVTEYRIDVQQGNVLSQEMVSQLRPGLTMDQVRYLLGTPVLADVFHSRRWDYIYRLRRGVGSTPVTRRFSVFFDEASLLQRVEGDLDVATPSELNVQPNRMQMIELGSDSAAPAKAQGEKTDKSAEKPQEKSPEKTEKGWWSRATGWIGF